MKPPFTKKNHTYNIHGYFQEYTRTFPRQKVSYTVRCGVVFLDPCAFGPFEMSYT